MFCRSVSRLEGITRHILRNKLIQTVKVNPVINNYLASKLILTLLKVKFVSTKIEPINDRN